LSLFGAIDEEAIASDAVLEQAYAWLCGRR